MPPTQHFVFPKLPTTLADRKHVDLPGYDVWFSYVTSVYVFPTSLDVSKFEDALSRALQLYPHAAGQLRCIKGQWSIELTNTAVPVDIEYNLDATPDSFLTDDWVIQDDISPFISQQPTNVDIVNGSAPLLRVKLIFFGQETSFGISWHHSLGDATMGFRFKHTLSQLYQGLPLKFSVPTFKKPHLPSPTDHVMANALPHMPQFIESGNLDPAVFAGLHDSKGHVRWRVDNKDVDQLHSTLCLSGRTLSKLDCLTAYFAAVLNHTESNLIRKIRYVISFRHTEAPFIKESLASNMTVQVSTDVPTDMAAIATNVRNALVESRRPEFIYDWVSVVSKRILENANEGEVLILAFEGDLMINSMITLDFCSAHFGCPDGTRFYMDRPWRYCLRVLKPNPVKGSDGVWRARQSVEISLGVPADLKPKVVDTLRRGVRYMLDREPTHVHARL